MKLLNHFIDDEIGNESGHLNLQKLTNCKKDEDIYRKAGTSFWVVDFELNDDLIIRGDSAWSAPIELIELLSIEFKELQFEIDYEELGCNLGGWAIIQNGVVDLNHFSFWEYKFVRDYEFACMCATEEIEYFISNDSIEELEEHDIKTFMKEEDFNLALQSCL